MTTNVVTPQNTNLVRPLRVLVPLIKDELTAGDAAGLEHYRVAGEMLLEAKAQLERGEWMGWVDRNFHLSASTARRYMQLAETRTARAFSSLRQAVNVMGTGRASWHQPVREIAARVNVAALARDRQDREREQHMMHVLSHQLIDIGYKVLASKLHPDKGGSTEAMARLNTVRKLLKAAL